MKNFLPPKLQELFFLKMKFALTSSVATLVDIGLFLLLFYFLIPDELTANTIAYTIAVIVNFSLQKKFVFSLERKVSTTFILAVGVSAIGLGWSNLIIWKLIQYLFFQTTPYMTKLVATGIVFFWNFYMKRFVFEKKFV